MYIFWGDKSERRIEAHPLNIAGNKLVSRLSKDLTADHVEVKKTRNLEQQPAFWDLMKNWIRAK